MSSNHIHLPPMPKPEEFGITASSWSEYARMQNPGYEQVKAYYAAVEAWQAAVSSIRE